MTEINGIINGIIDGDEFRRFKKPGIAVIFTVVSTLISIVNSVDFSVDFCTVKLRHTVLVNQAQTTVQSPGSAWQQAPGASMPQQSFSMQSEALQ